MIMMTIHDAVDVDVTAEATAGVEVELEVGSENRLRYKDRI